MNRAIPFEKSIAFRTLSFLPSKPALRRLMLTSSCACADEIVAWSIVFWSIVQCVYSPSRVSSLDWQARRLIYPLSCSTVAQ